MSLSPAAVEAMRDISTNKRPEVLLPGGLIWWR
jgi:hypothetical protein